VFDTRRGQAEGWEGDKILGFYPPRMHPNNQNSVVGLAQALTVFGGTFNQVGAGCGVCGVGTPRRGCRSGPHHRLLSGCADRQPARANTQPRG